MIVCSCLGITDGEIRDTIREHSRDLLAAGTCCGSCLPLISDIARKVQQDEATDGERSPQHHSGEPQKQS